MTIDNKNYNGSSLATELQSLLDANYTPGEYTVSYNINTGKINITSSTKYFKITYTQKETIDEFVSHVLSFTYNTELYSFNEKYLINQVMVLFNRMKVDMFY